MPLEKAMRPRIFTSALPLVVTLSLAVACAACNKTPAEPNASERANASATAKASEPAPEAAKAAAPPPADVPAPADAPPAPAQPNAIPAPADVAAAPKDAKVTA